MERTIREIERVFRHGVIPASNPHFKVETLPDKRQRLHLKSIPVSGVVSGARAPTPLLNQIVALIHMPLFPISASAYNTTGIGSAALALDTSQLQNANNIVGFDVSLGGWFVRFDPAAEHPYAKKLLLANWFGGAGFVIYLDSVAANFPDLTTLDVALSPGNEQGGMIVGPYGPFFYTNRGTDNGKDYFILEGESTGPWIKWVPDLSVYSATQSGPGWVAIDNFVYSLSDVATPDLASGWKNLEDDSDSDVTVTDQPGNDNGLAVEIYRGGNNQHSSGDVANATGTLLQSFSAAGSATLTWDFASKTATLT
jgi:hypothetical protein